MYVHRIVLNSKGRRSDFCLALGKIEWTMAEKWTRAECTKEITLETGFARQAVAGIGMSKEDKGLD